MDVHAPDLLGYGRSDRPRGRLLFQGGRADVFEMPGRPALVTAELDLRRLAHRRGEIGEVTQQRRIDVHGAGGLTQCAGILP